MSTLKVDAIRHNSATSDAMTNHSNGTASAKIIDIGGGQISQRNIVINGAMRINQRGDSTGNTSNGYYGPDRFMSTLNVGGTYSHSKGSSGSSLPEFPNSFKINCTSAGSSPSGTQEFKIAYGMEGHDLQQLQYGSNSAKKTTLTFYVRSNKTETYTIWYYRPEGARMNAINFSVSAANTWEKKVITIDGDTDTAIPDDNTEGMKFEWVLSAGGDMKSGTALNGSWADLLNANRYVGNTGTFGQSTSDVFEITGVQFEVGDTSTSFEHKHIGDELSRCQRYFEKITVIRYPMYPNGNNGDNSETTLPFKVQKRATGATSAIESLTVTVNGSHYNPTAQSVNSNEYGITLFMTRSNADYGSSVGIKDAVFTAQSELHGT